MNPDSILASIPPHPSGLVTGLADDQVKALVAVGYIEVAAGGYRMTAAGRQQRFSLDLAASGGRIQTTGAPASIHMGGGVARVRK